MGFARASFFSCSAPIIDLPSHDKSKIARGPPGGSSTTVRHAAAHLRGAFPEQLREAFLESLLEEAGDGRTGGGERREFAPSGHHCGAPGVRHVGNAHFGFHRARQAATTPSTESVRQDRTVRQEHVDHLLPLPPVRRVLCLACHTHAAAAKQFDTPLSFLPPCASYRCCVSLATRTQQRRNNLTRRSHPSRRARFM